jgi:hypothetical protein
MGCEGVLLCSKLQQCIRYKDFPVSYSQCANEEIYVLILLMCRLTMHISIGWHIKNAWWYFKVLLGEGIGEK